MSKRVISGTDDRSEAYQLAGQSALLNNSDGVALLAFASGLTTNNGNVNLTLQNFQSGYNTATTSR